MDIGAVVAERTIEEVWRAGFACFQDPRRLWRHESERGVAFDFPCLTLVAAEPAYEPIPAGYPYPRLVDEYMSWLFGDASDRSLLHRRLFRWDGGGESSIDQAARIAELLRRNPESRSAIFSLWRPDVDLESAYPPSPIAGSFRVLADGLHLFVVGRSADYWVGVVPDLLVMARLQHRVAEAIGRRVGSLLFHMWSAHIYEDEYLTNVLPSG